MHSFQQALNQTIDRMEKAQMQMLEYAIQNNWKILGIYTVPETGVELTRIEIPAKNRLPHSPEFYDFRTADFPTARANIARKEAAANECETLAEIEARTGRCYDCHRLLNECECR